MRIAATIIFLSVALIAYADQINITATLDHDQIYEGSKATLMITISGVNDSSIRPSIPTIDGASISLINAPTISTKIINGVMSREMIYSYLIMPKKKGNIEIPAFEVTVNETKYKTKPLTISVLDIQKTEKLLVRGKLSSDSTYILAPVTVKYDLCVAPGVKLFDLETPFLADAEEYGFFKLKNVEQENVLTLGRNRYYCSVQNESIDGVKYTVCTIVFEFFPTKSGNYSLDSPTVVGGIQKGTRIRRDFFGDVEEPNYQELRAKGDPLVLTVKPVPDEGKPEGYTGAVGKYAITVSANPTKAKVGDPIELKIAVSGDGLLEKVPRPDLTAIKGFSDGFKISETLQPGEPKGNAVIFNQIIRPLSTDIKEVPAIRFPYFDTESGKYEITESKPIPIEVQETTVVTASEVVKTPGDGGVSAINQTKVEDKPGGINAIYLRSDALIDQRVNLAYLWLLAFPAAGYFTAAAIVTRKHRLSNDKAFARAKYARKLFAGRLSEAQKLSGKEFYEALWKGIGGYISDRLDLGKGELTAYDLEQIRMDGRFNGDTIDELCTVLEQCDAGRFAAGHKMDNDRTELLNKCEALITRIDKELRR